jgi:hypothetical protein
MILLYLVLEMFGRWDPQFDPQGTTPPQAHVKAMKRHRINQNQSKSPQDTRHYESPQYIPIR